MTPVQPIPGKEHGDRILAQLGQGGMAQIQLAVRLGPGGFRKLYVIKRLRRDIANPAYANMFMHEARLAALLSHPNVVQSHEVNQEIDDCYLKMEYLEGQTLARLVRRVRRPQLPLEVHLFVLTELLAGLHHAHELKDLRGNPLQVVHRDVSPGNLILTYDGQVKLLDFGIAHSTEAVEQEGVGAIKGKIKYMSPEQAHGAMVDRRSDLYSVGIMLWEAIACGPFVIKGQTAPETLEQRRQGLYRPIQEVVPGVDVELVAICDKALALKPEDRYQTAEEFREAILHHMSTLPMRPGREDVSQVLQTVFSDERAQLEAMISEKISSGDDGHDLLFPETITGVRDARPANSAPPSRETPAKGSKRHLVVGGLLGVVGAFVALWFISQRKAVQPGPAVPNPPVVRPVAGAKSDPPKADSASARVKLTVQVSHEDATIIFDGENIGTGAVQHTVPKSDQKHRLVVELEGYEKIVRSMILDHDTRLELNLVELKAERSADEGEATRPAPKRKRSRSRKSSKKKSEAPTPEPASETPSERSFGDDLGGESRKRQRKIDKENPYS